MKKIINIVLILLFITNCISETNVSKYELPKIKNSKYILTPEENQTILNWICEKTGIEYILNNITNNENSKTFDLNTSILCLSALVINTKDNSKASLSIYNTEIEAVIIFRIYDLVITKLLKCETGILGYIYDDNDKIVYVNNSKSYLIKDPCTDKKAFFNKILAHFNKEEQSLYYQKVNDFIINYINN